MPTEERAPARHGAPVAVGPLAEVRAATAVAHQRLEHSLDLLAVPWSVQRHQDWLVRSYGLLAPLERALADCAARHDVPLDLPARRRASMVLADLWFLGWDAEQLSGIPPCPDVPSPATSAAAVGVCYVLDGSTLGGRLIRDAVTAAGIPADACTSLTGSAGNGRRWRETVQAVQAVPGAGVPELVAAAAATFSCFERWLAPTPVTTPSTVSQ